MNDIRQEDMAEQMGISRATLINYEKGHTTINVDILERFKTIYSDFDTEEKESKKSNIIEDNTINFKVLFDVLFNKKKTIIFSMIFSALLGIGFSFLFTPYFSAHISLYPAKKDTLQGLGQFQSLATNFGMKIPDNNQDFNITDVVKSRLIANKVLEQKWELIEGSKVSIYQLWKMDKQSWYSFFHSNTIEHTYINEKAIKIFIERIDVMEDRLTGLITITVNLEDPQISANVANFIGEQVQLYIQKENSANSTKEKKFISARVSIVKSELESSELDLKEFKERNLGYNDSPELFMVFSRIFREVEAKKQVYLTLQQQLELARIEEVKQASILHILDHAVPPSRKSSPKRILFLLFTTIVGFSGSCIIVIFKY